MQAGRIINRTNQLDLCALLMDMSMAGVLFGIGRRAAELGATGLELGLLSGAFPVTYTICALVFGGISDKLGCRRVAAGGAALASGFTLCCAFTTNVVLLIMINLLLGIGVGLFWPAMIAWIGEGFHGRALSKRMARFSVAWNIGMLIGFGTTGYLFEIEANLTFYVAAGWIAMIFVLLVLPLGDVARKTSTSEEEPELQVPKGRGFRKTSWLANFGMTFTFFGVVALFPQLATGLNIKPDTHGIILALWRAGAFTMFLCLPFFHFWQTRLWPVWAGQAVAVVAVLCFGFASNAWVFGVALFVGGLMLGFNYQCSIFFTLTEMTDKGKGSGVHEATLGGGMFLGPILAGWVGQNVGSLRAPYFFCAAFLLVWIVVQMLIVAWRRKTLE